MSGPARLIHLNGQAVLVRGKVVDGERTDGKIIGIGTPEGLAKLAFRAGYLTGEVCAEHIDEYVRWRIVAGDRWWLVITPGGEKEVLR